MFEVLIDDSENEESFYSQLIQQSEALIAGERDWTANLANLSALLNMALKDINWVGFYLYKDEELVLGPFQGKVACVRIEMGKGVCGTAALTRTTQVVKDVHAFPGHIACDGASNSEVVVPIVVGDKLIGVLDIDSPLLNRFSENDGIYLEKWVKTLFTEEETTLWS